jgi:hypothetical protein
MVAELLGCAIDEARRTESKQVKRREKKVKIMPNDDDPLFFLRFEAAHDATHDGKTG